jgi:hypothetical protein
MKAKDKSSHRKQRVKGVIRAAASDHSAADLVGKRVRLDRISEGQGIAIEEYELQRRIGHHGYVDRAYSSKGAGDCVSVLFDDGWRLHCLPEELELCDDPREPIAQFNGLRASTDGKAYTTPRYVQSCIAHVSFPASLSGLKDILGENGTDMEKLLWPPEDEEGGWTAPRWLAEGDVFFFYHTKKARGRIRQLLKQCSDVKTGDWSCDADREDAIARLIDQLEIAERYAGCIFGCALVNGAAAYSRAEGTEHDSTRHWRSNIYAPLCREYVFSYPLPDDRFRSVLTLSPGGALTPVHGQAFVELRQLLAESNHLPDYLSAAVPGGVSFRDIDKTNWMEVARSTSARFIDESQLRAFLLDYLVHDLKDARSAVYEECRCPCVAGHAGFADYFVRVNDQWFPVEAKLN